MAWIESRISCGTAGRGRHQSVVVLYAALAEPAGERRHDVAGRVVLSAASRVITLLRNRRVEDMRWCPMTAQKACQTQSTRSGR
jgi:hypothetical protein